MSAALSEIDREGLLAFRSLPPDHRPAALELLRRIVAKMPWPENARLYWREIGWTEAQIAEGLKQMRAELPKFFGEAATGNAVDAVEGSV